MNINVNVAINNSKTIDNKYNNQEHQDIIKINNEIIKQLNKDVLHELTDEKLLDDYIKCKSVNNAINKCVTLLICLKKQENERNNIHDPRRSRQFKS